MPTLVQSAIVKALRPTGEPSTGTWTPKSHSPKPTGRKCIPQLKDGLLSTGCQDTKMGNREFLPRSHRSNYDSRQALTPLFSWLMRISKSRLSLMVVAGRGISHKCELRLDELMKCSTQGVCGANRAKRRSIVDGSRHVCRQYSLVRYI